MAKERDVIQVEVRQISQADSLVELLGKCRAEDLAQLDAKIAAKQAEIDQLLAGHKAELEGLKGVRAFLAKKLGVVEDKPKKEHWTAKKRRLAAESGTNGTPVTSTGPAGVDNARLRRVAIARLLAGQGPLGPTAIANQTNIPLGSVPTYLKSDWFLCDEKTGSYRLTEYGRREAGVTAK